MSRPVSQRLSRIAIIGAPFIVAISAYVAMAQNLAQVAPSPSPTVVPAGSFRADQTAPIAAMPVPVQNVVSFESAFVSQLNTAIRNPQALTQGRPRVVVIVDHTAWKSFVVDRALVVVTSARVMTLTSAQMQEVRDGVLRAVDVAVQSEFSGKPALRTLGGATISGGNFTGTINNITTNRPLTGPQTQPNW